MATTVATLHDRAMTYADAAFLAHHRGECDAGRAFATQALPLEIAACRLLQPLRASEPTRGILYVSAASLAYQAGRWATMGRLARAGLRGYPASRERWTLTALARLARMKAKLEQK